jgi:hypothetical protein
VGGDWNVTWHGFDTLLLLSIAATGWSAWRRVWRPSAGGRTRASLGE